MSFSAEYYHIPQTVFHQVSHTATSGPTVWNQQGDGTDSAQLHVRTQAVLALERQCKAAGDSHSSMLMFPSLQLDTLMTFIMLSCGVIGNQTLDSHQTIEHTRFVLPSARQ